MSKRLIPLLDRVLVEKIIAPTKSVGGILLPESAVSKVRAIVIFHYIAHTDLSFSLSLFSPFIVAAPP